MNIGYQTFKKINLQTFRLDKNCINIHDLVILIIIIIIIVIIIIIRYLNLLFLFYFILFYLFVLFKLPLTSIHKYFE